MNEVPEHITPTPYWDGIVCFPIADIYLGEKDEEWIEDYAKYNEWRMFSD